MTVTGQSFEIVHDDQWLAVTEVGANLRGYRVGDVDVTPVYPTTGIAPKSCGAVLMPWPNRIAGGRYEFGGTTEQLALSDPALGNASHGLSCWIRWTPVTVSASEISLTADVVPQKGWPHEVRVGIRYVLSGDGLAVTLSATNIGQTEMPFAAGQHPYLAIGDSPLDEVEITLDAARRYLVDDHQIPTGTADVDGTEYDLRAARPLGALRLDTAFTALGRHNGIGVATVATADRSTTLWWDADAFSTVQLFTPPALMDAPAIAVEPMTGPANAFNSGDGLIRLEPGQSWSGGWGITPPEFR
jgi:aldose 1-epimerase